eukprot:scaffold253522_cov17-Tisochrysis_lutea.AAC.1
MHAIDQQFLYGTGKCHAIIIGKQLACQSKQLEAAGVPIEPGHAGILKGKEGVNTREVPTNCKLCRQDCR